MFKNIFFFFFLVFFKSLNKPNLGIYNKIKIRNLYFFLIFNWLLKNIFIDLFILLYIFYAFEIV
jgi:hypothetical protein